MHDDEITAYALAAGRGDAEAVTAFVRATQADVWRYVAYLVDRTSADDLTQETYLRALKGLRAFRGDTAARVWLLTIARRTVVDHFRKQGRRPVVSTHLDATPDIGDRIGPVAPDPANALALQSLIERLDQDKRAAFVLTQVTGLSYADAAAACEVPVGTIRSRVARAREDLVSWMADAETAQGPEASPEARKLRRLR